MVPLFIVFAGLLSIVVVSSYFTGSSLLAEMEKNGLESSNILIKRMEDNKKSLDQIESMLADKIEIVGKIVLRNEDYITNDFLTTLANDSAFEQINWYDTNGVIIASNKGIN